MNRMTELLERINYDLPGLKKAKMCYAQGDADGAMDAVIEHFRTRITPKYLFTAKEMEQFVPIYYCHPYSSWERGTNENQNKLIRRFCKKGKSMACVTADHAEYITLWMNNYPRRLLGWRRPADLMAAECAAMGIKLAV